MPPEEIWKPIPGYEGLYEVSNMGRVRSLDRLCAGRDGRSEIHHGRLMTPQTLWNGYQEVHIANRAAGVRRKHRTIHSLVAEVFIGPRPPKHDIMHIDGDRTNNCVTNLRYGTRKENLNQTYEYGRMKKLTAAQVQEIRRRCRAGERLQTIADDYGVHSAAIYHIRNGTAFKWLPEEVSV